MKIIQNTLKMEEKFSDVPKTYRVGPKKVGLVGFLETSHFFFFFLPFQLVSHFLSVSLGNRNRCATFCTEQRQNETKVHVQKLVFNQRVFVHFCNWLTISILVSGFT